MQKFAFQLQRAAILLLLGCFNIMTMAQTKTVEIRILQTSDVHGSFFPYDFISLKPAEGSMARVSSYVKKLRETYGGNLLLFDNGDILQGQPTCYYCNYIKPSIPNVAASVINYMGYDAQTVGNHDIETGHAVYDKWIKEVECPMLGANIIDTSTGKPYLKPWLEHVKTNEHPDVIIGLFHSGWDGGIKTDKYEENAVLRIAKEVPGFDLILYGHDHKSHKEAVDNVSGTTLCLNPSSNAEFVCDASIIVTYNDGHITSKNVEGNVVDIRQQPIDQDFMTRFKSDIDSVNTFVNRKIGTFTKSIYTRDSYFGNSAFCDFIHDIQLKVTGADISFNAPLSFDTSINAGDIHVSDMFNLYKYENQVYVLRMTGKEIHDYLEMSYALWTNTMTSPGDHIMLLERNGNGHNGYGFKNLAFNFDSAAGIDYEVDVTKPEGSKVRILRMSDGRPFDENKWYRVVMNSYRGNGGGELLTKGAGIPHDSLPGRVVYESERDQRFYLMNEIEKARTIDPQPGNNWRFVPSQWVDEAIRRDKKLLFS